MNSLGSLLMPFGGGPSPLKVTRRLPTSLVPLLWSIQVYTPCRLYTGLYKCTVYCTVTMVQCVQCVHKFTSQQGDSTGCQFYCDLGTESTSFQLYQKADQQIFVSLSYKLFEEREHKISAEKYFGASPSDSSPSSSSSPSSESLSCGHQHCLTLCCGMRCSSGASQSQIGQLKKDLEAVKLSILHFHPTPTPQNSSSSSAISPGAGETSDVVGRRCFPYRSHERTDNFSSLLAVK